MGCDIHLCIERTSEDGWVGIWDGYVTPRYSEEPVYMNTYADRRDYSFFAQLAGVRGDGPEPRGIPEDASPLARILIDSWGRDGHSHSYMPLREFCDLYYKPTTDEDVVEAVKNKMTGAERRKDSVYELFGVYDDADGIEFRIIFWFDN